MGAELERVLAADAFDDGGKVALGNRPLAGSREGKAARRQGGIHGDLDRLGPEHYGAVTELGLKTDERSNVAVDDRYMASEHGTWCCAGSPGKRGPCCGSAAISDDGRPGAI